MRVSIIRRLIYLFIYFFFSDFLPFSPPFLSAPRCLFFFRSSLSRVRPRTLTPGVSLCQFSGFSLALPSFFLVRNQFSSGDEVEDCTEFSSAVLPDWTPFQHRFFFENGGSCALPDGLNWNFLAELGQRQKSVGQDNGARAIVMILFWMGIPRPDGVFFNPLILRWQWWWWWRWRWWWWWWWWCRWWRWGDDSVRSSAVLFFLNLDRRFVFVSFR